MKIALLFLLAAVLWAQPNVTALTNAAGLPPGVSCAINCGDIGPNAWLTIWGTDLAPDTRPWNASDFINGQMPTSLDGVSVNFVEASSGAISPGFISYISPTQINVLTPLGLSGSDNSYFIQVVTPGVAPPNCLASPSPCFKTTNVFDLTAFFLYSGTAYVIAEHADGSLVGPPDLGATPAQPGETIVLYANGIGGVPTALKNYTPVPTIPNGSATQFFQIPSAEIDITINGAQGQPQAGRGEPVTVNWAGAISPGLYQFNIVIPTSMSAGDHGISVVPYPAGAGAPLSWEGGSFSPSGEMITIQ